MKNYSELTRPEKRAIEKQRNIGKAVNLCDQLDKEFPPHGTSNPEHSDTLERMKEQFAEIRKEYMADSLEEDEKEPEEKPTQRDYRKEYKLTKNSPIEIRDLVKKYRQHINTLLNFEERGQSEVLSELDRMHKSGPILPDTADVEAVLAAAFEFRRILMREMAAVTKETPPEILRRLQRWRDYDYRMLVCLYYASSKWGNVFCEIWRTVNRGGDFWERFRQEPAYKNLLKAKWQQDKVDPASREAYKGRDSRRRKSDGRRRYMKEYKSSPEYKAIEASKAKERRAAKTQKTMI